ncbi:putative UTP11-like U3 small nucleolar ribonucleo protein variant 1 [Coemansia reversa NRRL 1564]|uniref:U3 small nucleolar RNA-associated protein 11 n=1 Tax=Coemansia reversa (strain ATCC 12441 / NRRL 1564) TaxID=763665 RepID=A0A2G5BHM8_COERN|nr:putative UTP11-like U3 small nucleolar ribonucleo protein variant 1 [Coemansia reversa NRRL 1564]|eukprot:PIA18482.1 putative UTP11-like U3 small nucleolar ribonucleo protein variant 1 [Coemansia reversa NRRL 1564]
MVSSLKKFAPRREHKERGQISSRKHLGHLEKHKDYVLRAQDYREKQRVLKRLRERAATRNPDEFYFNMERSQMKDGVHIEERRQALTMEVQRLMDTQDVTYVKMQRDINRRKIEKLQSELHIADTPQGSHLGPRHTVFVDSEEEVRKFKAAEHFNTLPEFIDRKYNRPKIEALESGDIARPTGSMLKKAVKTRVERLQELKDRLEREEQLRCAESEMLLRRSLKEKGARKKVGKDRLGLAIYKWKAERKK